MICLEADETAQSLRSSITLIREDSMEDACISTAAQSAEQQSQIRIGKRLGIGSSCEVFSVQYLDGQNYAMKKFTKVEKFRKIILAEVEALSTLSHPHII